MKHFLYTISFCLIYTLTCAQGVDPFVTNIGTKLLPEELRLHSIDLIDSNLFVGSLENKMAIIEMNGNITYINLPFPEGYEIGQSLFSRNYIITAGFDKLYIYNSDKQLLHEFNIDVSKWLSANDERSFLGVSLDKTISFYSITDEGKVGKYFSLAQKESFKSYGNYKGNVYALPFDANQLVLLKKANDDSPNFFNDIKFKEPIRDFVFHNNNLFLVTASSLIRVDLKEKLVEEQQHFFDAPDMIEVSDKYLVLANCCRVTFYSINH